MFEKNGQLLRQINKAGQADFDYFLSCGLYNKLIELKWLIPHTEVKNYAGLPADPMRYKVIQPQRLPFVSYPYEWTFDQLKDAALLTLKIQALALSRGMILKDASAYNVQFVGHKPVLIDSLSFSIYEIGTPWKAYRQFCEHFVAPLAIAYYGSPQIIRTLGAFLDGLPLEMAVRLLPQRARFKKGLLAHLYMHSSAQRRYNARPTLAKPRKISSWALQGLIGSLEKCLQALRPPDLKTEWGEYYSDTNYTKTSFKAKRQIVKTMLKQISPRPKIVWDLGANDGTFSSLAAELGAYTVAFDIDPMAVASNYRQLKAHSSYGNMLPLVSDLTNPSPALGWAHAERHSLLQRGPADVALALALIHHLAVGNNLPLSKIADFMSKLCQYLIIEFVPKSDSKVRLLLSSREDIFKQYDIAHFEKAFADYFELVKHEKVLGSHRAVYLYKVKS